MFISFSYGRMIQCDVVLVVCRVLSAKLVDATSSEDLEYSGLTACSTAVCHSKSVPLHSAGLLNSSSDVFTVPRRRCTTPATTTARLLN